MEESKSVVVGLENIYGQLNNKELQENLSSFLPQLPGKSFRIMIIERMKSCLCHLIVYMVISKKRLIFFNQAHQFQS